MRLAVTWRTVHWRSVTMRLRLTSNNLEVTFDYVAFDNVASTLLLVDGPGFKLYSHRTNWTEVDWKFVFFTARRYASAVYAVVVCPSVRLSVCQSVCLLQAGTVTKWLYARSRKQRCTIAQRPQFSGAKNLREIPTGSPPTGHQIEVRQDRDIVTMES